MPYPFQPNARANAAGDDVPDWAVSDYTTFENAVNSGASSRRLAGTWDGAGGIIKTAGRKAPSPLDNLAQYAIDNYGVSPKDANEFKGFVYGYAPRHPIDAIVLGGMDKNDNPAARCRAAESVRG